MTLVLVFQGEGEVKIVNVPSGSAQGAAPSPNVQVTISPSTGVATGNVAAPALNESIKTIPSGVAWGSPSTPGLINLSTYTVSGGGIPGFPLGSLGKDALIHAHAPRAYAQAWSPDLFIVDGTGDSEEEEEEIIIMALHHFGMLGDRELVLA